MLIDADACSDQVDLFEKTFGDSVVVTISRAKKVAHLFQWDWATHLLDEQGRGEYYRAMAAALAKLNRATAPALAEYKRVEAAASAELNRADAAAWAEYDRVVADAEAELYRAKAAAFGKYGRAMATAWATAFIDMHKRGESA
jgi:cell division septum initiation protein DivIVA